MLSTNNRLFKPLMLSSGLHAVQRIASAYSDLSTIRLIANTCTEEMIREI